MMPHYKTLKISQRWSLMVIKSQEKIDKVVTNKVEEIFHLKNHNQN